MRNNFSLYIFIGLFQFRINQLPNISTENAAYSNHVITMCTITTFSVENSSRVMTCKNGFYNIESILGDYSGTLWLEKWRKDINNNNRCCQAYHYFSFC